MKFIFKMMYRYHRATALNPEVPALKRLRASAKAANWLGKCKVRIRAT